MKIVKERVPAENLPDIYKKVDKKYKGDYAKVCRRCIQEDIHPVLRQYRLHAEGPEEICETEEGPGCRVEPVRPHLPLFELQQLTGDSYYDIAKGERLYFLPALKEMHSEKAFASDANFTMRVSYGSIGGYRPYDAALV